MTFRPRRIPPVVLTLIPALLAAVMLILPLVRALSLHIKLTGQYEESLGYRYFYSLRQLFDPQPYVFLPQGHLIDVFNQGLHLFLRLCGLPITEVSHRIEVFGFCSVLLAHSLTVAAVFIVGRTVRAVAPGLAISLLAVLPFLIPAIYGFSVALQPDYLPWIPAVSTATLALLAAALQRPDGAWSWKDTLSVAALTAVALGVKMSITVFPAAMTVILVVVREKPLRSIGLAALSMLLGVIGWLGILLVNFHGHVAFLIRFFSDESRFLGSVGSHLRYGSWLAATLHHSVWPLRLVALLPVLLLAGVFLRFSRRSVGVVAGLVAGAAASQFVLFSRDVPTTWMEVTCFLCFAISAVFFARPEARVTRVAATAVWLILGAGAYQAAVGMHHSWSYYAPYLAKVSQAQRQAAVALAPAEDRIAFLIPDNSFRPLTIDSAIWKGGANILDGGHFGASELVRRLYPHRQYFSGSADDFARTPPDLRPFALVVFVIRKGMDPSAPNEQREKMESHFSVSLAHLRLVNTIDFGAQVFLIWTPAGDTP